MRLTQKLAPLFVIVAAALLVLPVTSRLHQNSASANSQKQVQAPVLAQQSTSDVAGKVKKEKSQPGKPRVPKGVPPPNDDCADAIAITSCPFDSETDTGGATDETGEPGSTCTAQGNSVWYSYATGANPALVTVQTCNGSSFDTAIMVYKVTGAACAFASFVPVACNDDACGDGLQSSVDFTADANSNYKIQVGGFDGDTGNLSVHVDCTVLLCPPVVVNGTLGSGSPDHAGFSGQQTTNRLFRDGVPSTCAVPKLACPGTFSSGSFTFDAYPFTNQSGSEQCVIVDYDPDTPAGSCNVNAHAVVYLNNYVPTNVCANYLADVGSSQHQSFSFNIPAGATFFIVIAANSPGGVGIGCHYKFTVLGNICQQFDYCVQDNNNPNRFIQINSTTGAYKFTDCGKNLTLSGTGGVGSFFCKTELFDQGPNPKRPDRFVHVLINPCTKVGDATIQFGPNNIVLHDSNITNNTCACPGQM